MRNRTLTFATLAAACAACCAPFVVPPVAVAIAGAGISGWLLGPVAAGIAALGILGFWVARRRQQPALATQSAEGNCGCAPDSGCNTGDSRDVPPPAKTTLASRIRDLC